MTVDVATAKHTHVHQGVQHYFCNPRCREKFIADPARYLDAEEKAKRTKRRPEPAGTLYTCPMHPQIVQQGPGICPICGMALEPKGVPAGDAGPESRACRFHPAPEDRGGADGAAPRRRHGTGPRPAAAPLDRRAWPGWIELALATPVVAWCGRPFFERGWASIVNRSPNMWTLISIGVLAAYAYSLVAVLAPRPLPARLSDARRHGRALLRGCRRSSSCWCWWGRCWS
jgi:Cu+-exporting ATPase